MMFFRKVPPRPKKNDMGLNQTEQRYAIILEMARKNGEIARWKFEAVRFQLAPGCTYTPDFMVVYYDRIAFHEVKGAKIYDDAVVKFKTASELYPEFEWKMVQWRVGHWGTILEY